MRIPRLALLALAAPCALVTWSIGCGGTGSTPASSGTGHGGTGTSAATGTGSTSKSAGTGETGGAGGTILQSTVGSGGSLPACMGLQCQIHSCQNGGSTTISGTIYDPAGKNPLYGVVAYVPNATPQPFTPGASCYSCSDLYTGDPIAAAVTDPAGKFTIPKAPDGQSIPLVIQVGKWRRQFTLPSVAMCQDNAVPDGMLTLPKNGGEGDLPNMAISTGSADSLECLLTRVGVDPAEYGPGPGGIGHIHIFKGNNGAPNTSPSAPDPSQALWDSDADILQYDIVLLSCEGKETQNMNQQVLFDYAKNGGRVFASHFHYAWFDTGPFGMGNLATWKTGSQDIGDIRATVVTTTWGGMPFQRGQDFAAWLGNVGALTNGELPIQAARHNADVSASNTPSQPWILADSQSPAPGSAQDFTFDTPLGAPPAMQCGRVAFSDMHVGAASNDYTTGFGKITPTGCGMMDLSPQEKALEFILFDLSSCVTPNNTVMQPPPPPPT
jgi:hypothetical protein